MSRVHERLAADEGEKGREEGAGAEVRRETGARAVGGMKTKTNTNHIEWSIALHTCSLRLIMHPKTCD